ncbi:MAG: glutamate synthase large subunit [Chloroflexi bacterium]|nr:glutamate synthase large subunit [Chloroflexota bacterium]
MSLHGHRLLYDPAHEHDACGVGFVADISGQRSHRILELAVESVVNLTHRGAVDADARTGDGAGILTQVPYQLLRRHLQARQARLERDEDLAVGMVFLPGQDPQARERSQAIIDATVQRQGFCALGWREVPVDPSCLGDKARATQPAIAQLLLGRPDGMDDDQFERRLFLLRKEIEQRVREESLTGCYIPSLSHRTIVYKGLFVAPQLSAFYPDLRDPGFTVALALFHQRYSTNTFPNWHLAQPFRFLGHNGEINTLQGNRNWMRARDPELRSDTWGEAIRQLAPVIQPGGSDSASLDNVLETLVLSGRDLRHSLMMLVPEAWENMPAMDPTVRGFYEYHACLTEPWDGPAALVASDGIVVAATLDRNGLRPARFKVTNDGIVSLASEVGVIELDDARVIQKGRLGPGQMIAVDTRRGQLLTNDQIKSEFAARRPYAQWVLGQMARPEAHHGQPEQCEPLAWPLATLQHAFGYTTEELHFTVRPMGGEGKDAVWSMGDDTALSVLAQKPRTLYGFFRQKFAQVTNPPIDPLREHLIMSLDTYLGTRGSLLQEREEHARLIHLTSPILTDTDLRLLLERHGVAFPYQVLPAVFSAERGQAALAEAVQHLCEAASAAVERGRCLLVISDRGVDSEHAPIPMALAVGAVHHHLIRRGQRMRASLIAETGDVRDLHHFAVLLGYGASAINPYLALASVVEMAERGELAERDPHRAQHHFKAAINSGLLKVMSKMGISTVSSYHGAQIFEAVGLSQEPIERYFTGTESQLGGIGLAEIAADALVNHRKAFGGPVRLEDHGYIRFRKGGEYHGYSPPVVRALHRAVRGGSYEDYLQYSSLLHDHEPATLRDLLDFWPQDPVPLEEVEQVAEILRRFNTAAMSIGALSPEAHKTIAIAMNRLGGKSNTGEGGEDPEWWTPLANGDSANSAIKQVASARFGVTPEYLARATELQIKMAQGSKPGEGGQLPGIKVAAHIARIRHAVPGVPLISPPPHHDIYSIEDLAQLIYDLKQVNPRARINVKLVAEAGVGPIAAGVAKAYADVIHISGHDGGTGASPLSSIKNAGAPWELGVAEAQQVLVLNDLRGRVVLTTDGGLKTGRDVIMAAILGAEEYGFGTAAVVAAGCDMARQCHLNTCPTGVATQREDLRAKFKGTPEHVMSYFIYVAQEVRELLASLGFRSLEEIVGRPDLLLPAAGENPRAQTLDLTRLLAEPDPSRTRAIRCMQERNNRPGDVPLDETILTDAAPALAGTGRVQLSYTVRNVNRAVGTRVAGEIAYRYGNAGLPDGTIDLTFRGTAGQSFGAFCVQGLRLTLEGEANDYVGKGMGGGEIVVKPSPRARFRAHANIIMGNTVLYGATGGYLFAAGRAGERFAVRNSGAVAVVEGVGDHGCEYMTAGVVVVLGETGRNFGAGMSNGVAFVLDEQNEFHRRFNPELVEIRRLGEISDEEIVLRDFIERHIAATSSQRGREILDRWTHYLPLFWKVAPFPPAQQVKPVEMLPEDEDEPTAPLSDNGAAIHSPPPGSPVGRRGLPDRTCLPNIGWSGRSRHPQTAST